MSSEFVVLKRVARPVPRFLACVDDVSTPFKVLGRDSQSRSPFGWICVHTVDEHHHSSSNWEICGTYENDTKIVRSSRHANRSLPRACAREPELHGLGFRSPLMTPTMIRDQKCDYFLASIIGTGVFGTAHLAYSPIRTRSG